MSNEQLDRGAQAAVRDFQESLARAMATKDPSAIRQIYKDLGTVLEEVTGNDLDSVRALSWPETAPVVAGAVSGRPGPILDAGCGPLPICATRHWRIDGPCIGVDLGLGTVRLAQSVSRRAGTRLLGVVADLEALPFRRDSFNAAICDDTIEHVPNDGAAVGELARVVAPNGPVVIVTPNRRRPDVVWRRLNDLARGRIRSGSHYFEVSSHLREYTWRELEEMARPSLRPVARHVVGWTGPGRVRRVLTRAITLPILGRHLSRALVLVSEPRP